MGDVVRTCRLERAAAAVDAALQCIFQLAVDPKLQVRCMRLAALAIDPVPAVVRLHMSLHNMECLGAVHPFTSNRVHSCRSC